MSAYLCMMLGAFPSEITDPNFKDTVLLIHADGTNGAQNNTFIDSSSNNFSITRNGNATQGSFSPFSKEDGKWGNSFPGSSSYLYTTLTGGLGSGNFTVEFFVLFNSVSAIQVLFDGRPASTSGAYPTLYLNGSQKLVYGANSADRITGTTTIAAGTWYYVALQRSGTDTKLYLNAVQEGSTYSSDSTNYAQVTNRPVIGGSGYTLGNEPLLGHISNLRISNTARTISVPTAPYSSDGNTSLLCCQSNRFKDNSSNAFTLTPNGNVAVTPFSPFANSAAYSASVNGGSGYFDGTLDYLDTASNAALALGTSDFLIECFYYPIAKTDTYPIISSFNGGWAANVHQLCDRHNSYPNNFSFQSNNYGGFLLVGTSTVNNGQWYHVAVSRSGSTFRLYVNGAKEAEITWAGNIDSNASSFARIGAGFTSGNEDLNGYLSGYRVLKGTALYTGETITVPSAPLTPTSQGATNTQLLLNFTNAAIYDQTGTCDLETVGNAQISTSVKKYGTGSMAFDGAGDYLKVSTSDIGAFGTGDFTIEMWVYFNSISGTQNLIDFRTATADVAPTIALVGSALILYVTGSTRITTSTLSALTWYHIACVRSAGVTKLYIDGTQSGSNYTDTNSYVGKLGRPWIGELADGTTPAQPFNGYIDDLRISRYARYTGTFTPPTAAFADR